MREFKSLESILENLDTKKYQVPEDWPFKEARRLFIEPEITDPETLEVKLFFSICVNCIFKLLVMLTQILNYVVQFKYKILKLIVLATLLWSNFDRI